jgi:hypothetical protein
MVTRTPIFDVSDVQHVTTRRLYAYTEKLRFIDLITWTWEPAACWTPNRGTVRSRPLGYLLARCLGAREVK